MLTLLGNPHDLGPNVNGQSAVRAHSRRRSIKRSPFLDFAWKLKSHPTSPTPSPPAPETAQTLDEQNLKT